MLRILTVVAVVALVVSTSSAWVIGEAWVELIDYGLITDGPEAGNYEYIYDVHNDVDTWARTFDMHFDATGVVNQFDYVGYNLMQSWSSNAAGVPRLWYGGYIDPERWPSYWNETTSSWDLPTSGANVAWAMDNVWHDGGDYNIVNGLHTWDRGNADDQGVHWLNQTNIIMSGLDAPGLMFTFRLVHPQPKGVNNIPWDFTISLVTSTGGMVDGPVPEPATMSLLALGGLAVLRKRRRA